MFNKNFCRRLSEEHASWFYVHNGSALFTHQMSSSCFDHISFSITEHANKSCRSRKCMHASGCGRIMPCNYTRDEACLITSPRVSYKNCSSAHQRLARDSIPIDNGICVNVQITKRRQFTDSLTPPPRLIRTVNHTAYRTHTYRASTAENTT